MPGLAADVPERVTDSHREASPPRSRVLPVDLFLAAPATNGPVCYQVQQQVASICITGTRPPSMGSRCTQPALEGSGPLCLSTSSHLGHMLQEYQCKRIILIALGWPNMPCFWDLVAMSSQVPMCVPIVLNLLTQPSNQIFHSDESSCLAPRASAIKEQGFSEAVVAEIEAPQSLAQISL